MLLRALLLCLIVTALAAGSLARACPSMSMPQIGMNHEHHDQYHHGHEAPAPANTACDPQLCCAFPTPQAQAPQVLARAARYAAYRLPAAPDAESLPPPMIERPPKLKG